jgi:hypothetical protein
MASWSRANHKDHQEACDGHSLQMWQTLMPVVSTAAIPIWPVMCGRVIQSSGRGNPAARIKENEVTAAFRKPRPTK